jgi:DNA-binding NarL/FixJ family response regulator
VDALLRVSAQLLPDVVITDIRMPPYLGDDGLEAAHQLRSGIPPVNVLVLSQHVPIAAVDELLGDRSGGVGFLLKQRITDVDEFCRAVRRVGRGGTALDPEVIDLLMRRAHRCGPTLPGLTSRQHQVLALIAQGRSNLAIARALGVTEKAVVRHASHIYEQLEIAKSDDDHRRVLAVVQWLTADQEPV